MGGNCLWKSWVRYWLFDVFFCSDSMCRIIFCHGVRRPLGNSMMRFSFLSARPCKINPAMVSCVFVITCSMIHYVGVGAADCTWGVSGAYVRGCPVVRCAARGFRPIKGAPYTAIRRRAACHSRTSSCTSAAAGRARAAATPWPAHRARESLSSASAAARRTGPISALCTG